MATVAMGKVVGGTDDGGMVMGVGAEGGLIFGVQAISPSKINEFLAIFIRVLILIIADPSSYKKIYYLVKM